MLVYNIGQLLTMAGPARARRGKELLDLGILRNAFLEFGDGVVGRCGAMEACPAPADHDIDAAGNVAVPGFVDCHTHLVNAGNLQGTFADRCRAVEDIDPRALARKVKDQIGLLRRCGTTTVEIKTGYANSAEAIDKCLHAVPRERGIVLTEMSPLADSSRPRWSLANRPRFIDALCDPEGFSPEQLAGPLAEMQARGVGLKLHTCVTAHSKGVALAVKHEACSVDHLLYANSADATLLARSQTIGVLLPSMVYYTKAGRFAPARMLIDGGAAIALGTDFNPGDSPTPLMPFAIHLACRNMGMTGEESLAAATINAAYAIGEGHRAGSLEAGKDADCLILETNDYRDLPLAMGAPMIRHVIQRGRLVP